MPSGLPQKKPGAVSLRDVAAAAGVSRMTASRAFKADASIRPELRAKVVAVAEELGYKPDLMVSQIMSSFANHRVVDYRETIAVLWWPDRWATAMRGDENYCSKIYRGLETSAALHGCKIEHISTSEEMSPRVINRILKARNIQSMIITPPSRFDQPVPDLNWEQLSVVSIGTTLHKPRLHRSRISHFHSMVLALEKIAELGYQRPCLLLKSDLEQRMDRAYTGAFMAWNNNAETMIRRQKTLSARGLKTWIKDQKPDVVIGDILDWRQHLPEPYARKRFVTLNVMSQDSEISGVFQNTELLAEYAVDLLMRVRLRKETGVPEFPLTIVCDGKWVTGKTLQPN